MEKKSPNINNATLEFTTMQCLQTEMLIIIIHQTCLLSSVFLHPVRTLHVSNGFPRKKSSSDQVRPGETEFLSFVASKQLLQMSLYL
jgi:hypothetical protein